MSRKVNYFEAQRPHVTTQDTALVIVVSSVLGSTLSAIESRKPRSFWLSDAAFVSGYNELTRQQWELLMDATDRVISEIRALRSGSATTLEDRNPALDPYGLALTTLRDLDLKLVAGDGTNAATLLEQIRDLLANQESEEESLAILRTIAGLLAAL